MALASTWAFGAVGVALHLALGVWRARRLVRRARRDDVGAFADAARAVVRETGVSAEVAISDDIDAPAVAGMIRQVVLMPRAALDWTEERWRLVLLHELAHVARRDCLAGAVAELACAVHWFDPLAWIARHRLRHERELAADEDVLAAGHLASDYATHLLAIATASRNAEPAGALAMTAKPSQLADRIEKLVTRETLTSAPPALLPGSVVAVGAMALAVACANPRPPSATGGEPGAAVSTPTAPSMRTAASPPVLASAGSNETNAPPAVATDGVRAPIAQEVAKHLGVAAPRVELTIVPALQSIVEDELSHLVAEHHPRAATAIVLDPSQGEILAIGDLTTARRAFVTGSTIKPMTAAAALETGSVRLEQKFDCRPRSIGARTINDAKDRGVLDLAGIIEVSSNVGASRLFDAIGKDRFDEVLARFHLGDGPTIELPDVARGDVPKTARLDAYDGAMVAIGEGLTATPLQMSAAYGVFANRGEYVAPTLVRKLTDGTGRTAPPRAAVRERIIRVETARTVMQMLERAVNGEQATGKRARVQGVRVAGKTGTAGWTAPDGKEHVYASFIGIVPADAPRYVILVGAEDPGNDGWGPVVAAPAFAKIAARALGVP
jgi:cell division protein FtsI (penicillin-binding protein 3)